MASVRSQDLPPAYVINGALYLITPANLRGYKSFYGNCLVPLVMDQPAENVDIDTETDWQLAEAFLSLGQSPNLDLVPRP